MDPAYSDERGELYDRDGLQKLVAEVRSRLGAAMGDELRSLAQELTKKLTRFAEQTQDRTLAARALCAAAEETEDALHDTEGAIRLFERALELNPALERAATQLDILLQRHDGFQRRGVMLEQRASALDQDHVASESMRAVAWRQAASAWSQGEDSRNRAIDAYERAIAIDPEVDSLEALAELYTARGEEGDDEQAADLLTCVAEALQGGEAIHYAQRALDLLPDHSEAMALLETLVPQAQQGRVLRSRLEAYIEAAGADEDADPRRIRLARIYGSEGLLQQALACLKPAIERGDADAAKARRELLDAALRGSGSSREGETLVGVPLQWAEDDLVSGDKPDRDAAPSKAPVASKAPEQSISARGATAPAANKQSASVRPAQTIQRQDSPSQIHPQSASARAVAAKSSVRPPTPSRVNSGISATPPPAPRSLSTPVAPAPHVQPVVTPRPVPQLQQPAPLEFASAPMPNTHANELSNLGRNPGGHNWLPWVIGALVVAAVLALLLQS